MMKLYGSPPTRAVRAIWLMNALDIDCEMVSVDFMTGEHKSPAFLAINPFGKVPALVDGDMVLAESVAIMMHLAATRGGGQLIPSDPAGQARMNQWNMFLVTEIEQPLWRMALHSALYPEADRNQDEIALARRDCLTMLAPLEAHLAEHEHLVGTRLSVADFNAAYTLDWADQDGCLLDTMPSCRQFVERMYDRPDAPPRIAEAFAQLNRGYNPSRYRSEVAAEDRIEGPVPVLRSASDGSTS